MNYLIAWLVMIAWSVICVMVGYAGGRWDAKA